MSMRWEDERYVRVYTRDTPEWIGIGWEARSVFYELCRKVDRTGFMPMGRTGYRGVSGLLHIPVDIITAGMEALIEDGCVQRVADGILIPNFLEAQEARQSDAMRKRQQRQRDRDSRNIPLPLDLSTQNVTQRDSSSDERQRSHAESRAVQSGHVASPEVTSSHPVPCCTVPCLAVPNQKEPPIVPRSGDESGSDGSGAGESPPGFVASLPASGHAAASSVAEGVGAGEEQEASATGPSVAVAPRSKPSAQMRLDVGEPFEAPERSGAKPVDEVWEVWMAGWRRIVGAGAPPKLNDARKKLIRRRLTDGYGVDALCSAVRGIWLDAWHVEHKVTSLEFAIRNAAHIEKFSAIDGEAAARAAPAKAVSWVAPVRIRPEIMAMAREARDAPTFDFSLDSIRNQMAALPEPPAEGT